MSEEQVNTPVESTESTAPVEETATEATEAAAEVTDPVVETAEKVARKLKLKIDGVEQELSEEEVIALAQQGKAAQKRFSEAAKMRKESARFLDMLKENPLEVLTHPDIGVDVKKFAEDYLMEEIKKQEMSPEAQKAYELEQKLAQLEKEKQEQEAQKQQEAQAKMQQQYAQEYEEQIQGALEKSGLPKTAQSVQRMAIYMAAALENDTEIHPEQAAQLVKQDYLSDIVTMLGQSDGETLLSLLGEDVATKIRKTDLAKLEASLKPKVEESQEESVVERMPQYIPDPDVKKMTPIEWREYMDKIRNS